MDALLCVAPSCRGARVSEQVCTARYLRYSTVRYGAVWHSMRLGAGICVTLCDKVLANPTSHPRQVMRGGRFGSNDRDTMQVSHQACHCMRRNGRTTACTCSAPEVIQLRRMNSFSGYCHGWQAHPLSFELPCRQARADPTLRIRALILHRPMHAAWVPPVSSNPAAGPSCAPFAEHRQLDAGVLLELRPAPAARAVLPRGGAGPGDVPVLRLALQVRGGHGGRGLCVVGPIGREDRRRVDWYPRQVLRSSSKRDTPSIMRAVAGGNNYTPPDWFYTCVPV